MGSNIHTRNIVGYTPTKNPFIPVVKSTPQLQFWGNCLKEEVTFIIVTDNTGYVCPIGLTLHISIPQNNKLIIQIDRRKKSCYIQN